jgi:3-oxoacyl-[acyl-carrier-protein] synthase-1
MSASNELAILEAGLVCSVGLDAASACAAIRAGVTHHRDTTFMDAGGEWIVGASVPLDEPWRGRAKLAKLLAMAVRDCVERAGGVDGGLDTTQVPLILCVAEKGRPGRLEGLEEELFTEALAELGWSFHSQHSSIVSQGRVGMAIALAQARRLVHYQNVPLVLIAGVDSLLVGPTLAAFEENERLLTTKNSNGFVPGEGASAVLVGRPVAGGKPSLTCTGLGFAMEHARIDTEEPLRAEGLTLAIKLALGEAQCQMAELDFRITDLSGEQYYFKEAALAFQRAMRTRKETFDIWHPADCIGEIGAAIGPAILAVALEACRKGYALGERMLCHLGSDAGPRAAGVFRYAGRLEGVHG